jgi:putative holliday junction resolvase
MKKEKKIKIFLGVDWGTKRLGLAFGDSENRLALPYGTVDGIDGILEALKKEKADALVLGQPLKMSGAHKKLDPDFEKFFASLKKKTDVPVLLIDERLSSLGADSLSGTKKNKAGRDALAAMLILQSYLDAENFDE